MSDYEGALIERPVAEARHLHELDDGHLGLGVCVCVCAVDEKCASRALSSKSLRAGMCAHPVVARGSA